jgi:hypothetical protein
VVLCRPLLGIGPNPSTKDAELIAFRVGEYHPRRVTLPDANLDTSYGLFPTLGFLDIAGLGLAFVLVGGSGPAGVLIVGLLGKSSYDSNSTPAAPTSRINPRRDRECASTNPESCVGLNQLACRTLRCC